MLGVTSFWDPMAFAPCVHMKMQPRHATRSQGAYPSVRVGMGCRILSMRNTCQFQKFRQHSLVRQVTRDEQATTENSEASSTEGYDVYVYQPEPLEEGVVKHTISVFVADEAGIINRVAGVFARRGANIESLAVGLNVDKALFTIVVTGRASTVANLVKQLGKLVKVRFVEDITKDERVERELLLLKLRAPPGPARTEVMQLAEIFRARVVDVSERCLTLAATGDPGKTMAFQKVMSKFGIIEAARTGKIALKRGEELLEDGMVGPGGDVPPRSLLRRRSFGVAGSEGAEAEAADGDVYVVDGDTHGVWEVSNVLDATYQGSPSEYAPHTLNIEVEDKPGVLNQVTGVFARRGYNVQSLAVGSSEREGMSRICMVLPGSQDGISNLIKQLHKLAYVQKVTDLTGTPAVSRELMLVKVKCSASQRGEMKDLADIFHGTICDVSLTTLSIEVTGKEDKMQALQQVLEAYGILEVARTGRVALARDSGVDTRFLERMKSIRVMV